MARWGEAERGGLWNWSSMLVSISFLPLLSQFSRLPFSLSPRLAVPVSALFPLIERISPLAVKVAQVLGLNEIEACGIDARQ